MGFSPKDVDLRQRLGDLMLPRHAEVEVPERRADAVGDRDVRVGVRVGGERVG